MNSSFTTCWNANWYAALEDTFAVFTKSAYPYSLIY